MKWEDSVPLGELTEDHETLLDNLDLLHMANELSLFDDYLVEVTAVKVVNTIEVVKVVKRLMTSPSVEGEARGPGREVFVATG
jgi:hypothetical protein